MKKILSLLLILYTTTAVAQTFKGTIIGSVYDGDDNLIWNLKLVIKSSTDAIAYFYDYDKGAYVEYTKDPRFAGQKRNVYFNADGNFACLQLVYSSSTVSGQSIYNFSYSSTTNSIDCIWTNLSDGSTKILAAGTFEFFDPSATTYSSYDLKIGGKSFDYLSIGQIKTSTTSTMVEIKITNNKDVDINGTFHEASDEKAFYITDANRSKKYKLKSASQFLPYSFTCKPGKTISVTLTFEPIPSSMTLLNIFEGGDTEQLWKFFDVKLLK